jgi:hypothetical protein
VTFKVTRTGTVGAAFFLLGCALIVAGRANGPSVSESEAAAIFGGTKRSVSNDGCIHMPGCGPHASYTADNINGSPNNVTSITCGGMCGLYLAQVKASEGT